MPLTEIVHEVIRLGDIVKEETEERNRQSPLGTRYEFGAPRRDPTQTESNLKEFLLSQPIAVIYTLTLLMYVGRGDFDIEDFLEQYEEMKGTFDTSQRAVGQMVEKTPLPDHLRNGLASVAKQGIDLDDLMN